MEGKEQQVTTTEKAIEVDGVHPFADQFPMLLPAEMDELVESVKANGLRNPIVLTRDADKVLILDGRNRFAACQRAEVEPTFVFYEGDDLAQYVIDTNTTRRNLTTGQRAMSTALVLKKAGYRKDGKWDGAKGRGIIRGNVSTNDESAWVKAITQCGIVLDWADDLAEKVRDGAELLHPAYTEAVRRRTAKEKDSEKLKVIQAELPTVAEKIAAGDMTLEEANKELEAAQEVKEIDLLVAEEKNRRTFTQRVEAEEITWVEARELARKWKKEWDEAAERSRRRIFDILAGWAGLTQLLNDPDTTFNKTVLEKLGDNLVPDLQKIVAEMAANATKWNGAI
jgi:hypothetical protein